jgi:hypothetical protein
VDSVPDAFGAPRDTDAYLQRCEAGAKVAARMDCAQRGQAQPGCPDSDGPDTPPPGSRSGRSSLSVSSGSGGRRPASMSLKNPRQPLRADGRRLASMMRSYVQPVSAEAVPRRRRERTEVRVSAVMQRGSLLANG